MRGIHARDQHHGADGLGLEVAVVERGDEAVVVLQELVGRTHGPPVSHPARIYP